MKLRDELGKIALVCGSHTEGSEDHVWKWLDDLRAVHRFDRIVTGGAAFIDSFAMTWAMRRQVCFMVEYPDWERWGPSGGPERNGRMRRLWTPDLVIAFPGGPGTLNMMQQARAAGITVVGIT